MDKEDRKKLADERRRVRKHQKDLLARLEKEETVRVQFQSLEGPEQNKQPLDFTYESVKRYVLLHNGVYDLPQSVVNSIRQRCRVPVYKQYDETEVSGGDVRAEPIDPEKRIAGFRARFALVPVEPVETAGPVAA